MNDPANLHPSPHSCEAMDTAVSTPFEPSEQRHGDRTHLFVIATLCWNAGTMPVHIRNMSAKGALIEAAVLPQPGSLVVLKRGSLEASGRVAWASSGRAGLAFGSVVRVTDWMARRATAHQDRVDEIVAALKAEELQGDREIVSDESYGQSIDVETELGLLRADLTKLGDALAADIILVATHPEIQLIDMALQRIERIMGSIHKGCRQKQASRNTMLDPGGV
jgi:hypothetical protein